MLEQPLPADDLEGHAEVARRVRTPVCLDESITSEVDLDRALALGACSIVNIKPARLGGLLAAKRVHDRCVEAGVPAWCGGMLETGIGRAANLALAALPGFTLPGDLSASDRYFESDLTPTFVLDDGQLAVPAGPGIGVQPLPDVLDAVTHRREVVTPPG
jgi:O-succinylbenzoate synthase